MPAFVPGITLLGLSGVERAARVSISAPSPKFLLIWRSLIAATSSVAAVYDRRLRLIHAPTANHSTAPTPAPSPYLPPAALIM
jgi:hypothetical protein